MLIAHNALPIPNVDGGAIETLITHLLNENEKQNKKMPQKKSTTILRFIIIMGVS